MNRHGAVLVLACFVVVVVVVLAVASARSAPAASPADIPRTDRHRRLVGYGQIAFDFAGPEKWAARWRRQRREVDRLRRELREQRRILLRDPQVVEAINLAAVAYGNAEALWRKARCETGGTFSPRARNTSSGAAGLFQFLPSTWESTPYGVFSIWSPYANALAAGWMHAAGRGGEWVCR